VPIVAPLVAELAAGRQANERQAAAIRDQAERIDVLTAEVAALKAAHSPVVSNQTLEPPGVAPDVLHGWRGALPAWARSWPWSRCSSWPAPCWCCSAEL
jgi:hypothetical protein